MIASAALVTYVWHYVIARLLYDELIHPLVRGNVPAALVVVAAAVALLLLRRRA